MSTHSAVVQDVSYDNETRRLRGFRKFARKMRDGKQWVDSEHVFVLICANVRFSTRRMTGAEAKKLNAALEMQFFKGKHKRMYRWCWDRDAEAVNQQVKDS